MTKFQDKYRVESARPKGYDYSSPGWYFVTICTKNRVCCLADIIEGQVRLSPIGEIIRDEWLKTPTIRQNVELDEWVIMPNHIHGIIVITRGVETTRRVVSTTLHSSTLGSIIGQIKSVCTKRIRAQGFADFDWQERFFDEIIRDEKELNDVRQYILSNPANWSKDKENPSNLRM